MPAKGLSGSEGEGVELNRLSLPLSIDAMRNANVNRSNNIERHRCCIPLQQKRSVG